MLKFYISTVIIYFVIFTAEGLLFKNEFRKNLEKLIKETGSTPEQKRYGFIKTTVSMLLVSFIPFIRLVYLIVKLLFVFNVDVLIKFLNENKKRGD